MIKDKKVAGILIESQLKGSYLSQSIIGIGLNINQREFPGLPNATSLWRENGEHRNRMLELKSLCGFIEQRYLRLKSGRNELLRKEYVERLYKVDQWLDFEDIDGVFHGRLINVEPSGRLLVERKGGEIRSYAHKEIKFHGLSS
jgi:BirA family biotin operon repressor/biotin-[acetyl-CoA-carboxylase] ligase